MAYENIASKILSSSGFGRPRSWFEQGNRNKHFEGSTALTGFQFDYLELPRVVSVIAEQLLLDQKITDLGEALHSTPGDGFGSINDDFSCAYSRKAS